MVSEIFRTLRIGGTWACLGVCPLVWNFKFQTFFAKLYFNIYHIKKIPEQAVQWLVE